MTNSMKLSWLLCAVGILLLLRGAVDSLALVSANKVGTELKQEDVARLARSAYQAAMTRLQEDPSFSGPLTELTDGSVRCQMTVVNRTASAGPSYHGRTWIPAHSILLDGLILADPRGSEPSPFQTLAEYQRPRFSKAEDSSDPGAFTSPLPPSSKDLRFKKGAHPLPAGSYRNVTLEPGASVTLKPQGEGYTSRFHSLHLHPGAEIKVEGDTPAILYIAQSLKMEKSTANSNGAPAMLQIYLLPKAEMSLTDCPESSLVAAGPTIRVTRSQLTGALHAAELKLEGTQVTYQDRLRGLTLDGLGPLTLKDDAKP